MEEDCKVCNQIYNRYERSPRQLPCQHMLCITCAMNAFQKDNFIKCHVCSNVCNKEPQHLLIPFLQLPKSEKECKIHEGCFKLFYCYEDKELLCGVCSQIPEHNDHDIREAAVVIQKLKENQIKKIKNEKNKKKDQIQLEVQLLQKELQNIEKQQKQYTQEIQASVEHLIQEINQIMQRRIESMEQKTQEYISEIQSQIIILQQQQKEFEAKYEIKDEEDINELLFFIKTHENSKVQLKEKLQIPVIQFEYNVKLNDIENFISQQLMILKINAIVNEAQAHSEINIYHTIRGGSNVKISCNLRNTKNQSESNLNIPNIYLNYARVLQIDDVNMILSGGDFKNNSLFKIKNQETQEFQMFNTRGVHQMVYDN